MRLPSCTIPESIRLLKKEPERFPNAQESAEPREVAFLCFQCRIDFAGLGAHYIQPHEPDE